MVKARLMASAMNRVASIKARESVFPSHVGSWSEGWDADHAARESGVTPTPDVPARGQSTPAGRQNRKIAAENRGPFQKEAKKL
jgi:hypothetical protein